MLISIYDDLKKLYIYSINIFYKYILILKKFLFVQYEKKE